MEIGDRKNRWTYIRKSEKPYYGWFRCDCGTEKENRIRNIENGLSKSCGCLRKEKDRQKAEEKYIGKKYGRLTITDIIRKNNRLTHFRCKCDCGNETVVTSPALLGGGTISCGCYKSELNRKYSDFLLEESKKNLKKYKYDGTIITALNQKVSKNSTTGIKGVSKMKNGKYRAYINLRRGQKHLGVFETLEEAKQARAAAEKEYFEPVIEEWEKEKG